MHTCSAMPGALLTALLLPVVCGLVHAQEKDSSDILRVGFDAGLHSASASGINRGFNAGPVVQLTLLDLRAWSRTRWAVSVSYWHGRTTRAMAGSDDAKGAHLELRYEVAKAGGAEFSAGPQVGVEGVNHAAGGVFCAGITARGEWPLDGGRLLFLVRATARTGSNVSVNVSGYSYAYFAFTAGLLLNLGNRE